MLCKKLHVEVRLQLESLDVDLEDSHPFVKVRKIDMDLPVEAPGTEKSLVKDVRTIGSRKNDDAGIGVEAVHLRKELVERILSFIVGREAYILASCPSDGVDFIDEDYARGLLLRLTEKVADS